MNSNIKTDHEKLHNIIQSYDNLFLPTNNIEASMVFYENLGFKVKFNFADKGMVAFSLDDEEVAIILKDINKFPNQKPTIWFVVEDTNKAYGILKKRGIQFLSEPFRIGTGVSAEFEDNFGNRLGITDYNKD